MGNAYELGCNRDGGGGGAAGPDAGTTCSATEQFAGAAAYINKGPMAAPLRGAIGCVDLTALPLRLDCIGALPSDSSKQSSYNCQALAKRPTGLAGNTELDAVNIYG